MSNGIKNVMNNPTHRPFDVKDKVEFYLDLNQFTHQQFRANAEFVCRSNVTGEWRRRIIERVGYQNFDTVVFEFGNTASGDPLREHLMRRVKVNVV